MNKSIKAGALLLALCISGMSSAHKVEPAATINLDKEPFAFSYHGVLVDTNMKEIELSPTFLEATIHFYTESAIRTTSRAIYDQYRQLHELISEDARLSELDKLKLRYQIAEKVFSDAGKVVNDASEKTNSDDNHHEFSTDELRRWQEKVAAARLNIPKALKLEASREELAKTMNGLSEDARSTVAYWVKKYNLQAFETLAVAEYILWPVEWLYPIADPYMKQCRDAGVPIPPAFGSSQWSYVGQLNNEFIDDQYAAKAYTYTSNSPAGTCIALPRINSSGGARVLGIICLGLESENACFWDRYGTTEQELAGTIPISEFIPGTEFDGSAGNCASCHAGENPFVIHPEADISGGANISVNWHTPIFNPAWPRNPGPMTLPSDTSYSVSQWWNPFSWFDEREDGASCAGCHKLPDVTNPTVRNQGYCNSVLKLAAQRTMPPWSSGTAGWGSNNDSDYQVHIERLYDLCN